MKMKKNGLKLKQLMRKGQFCFPIMLVAAELRSFYTEDSAPRGSGRRILLFGNRFSIMIRDCCLFHLHIYMDRERK